MCVTEELDDETNYRHPDLARFPFHQFDEFSTHWIRTLIDDEETLSVCVYMFLRCRAFSQTDVDDLIIGLTCSGQDKSP